MNWTYGSFLKWVYPKSSILMFFSIIKKCGPEMLQDIFLLVNLPNSSWIHEIQIVPSTLGLFLPSMPKFGETLEDDIKVGTDSWMGSSFWWHKDGVIIWSAKNWLDIWFETWIHPVFLDVQCFETVPVLIGVAMMWLGFGWAASNSPYGAWSHLFNILN